MVTRQGRNYLWILKRYKMSSAWRKISLHYSYLTLFFCSKLTETNEGLEFCYHGTCVDWAPGWHPLRVCEKWKSRAPISDLTESHVHIKPVQKRENSGILQWLKFPHNCVPGNLSNDLQQHSSLSKGGDWRDLEKSRYNSKHEAASWHPNPALSHLTTRLEK